MLGGERVLVLGDTTLDADNNPIPGSGEEIVDGCLVSPMSATELREVGRDGDQDVVRVQLPITSGVTATTRLKVRGLLYRVDGTVQPFLAEDDPELSGYDLTATRTSG